MKLLPEEKLYSLIEEGVDADELAQMFSCSSKTIQRRAESLGLKEKLKKNTHTASRKRKLSDVAQAMKNTNSPDEVAKAVNLSVKAVYSYMAEAVNTGLVEWNADCENCGKPIEAFRGQGRFCSLSCSRSYSTSNLTEEQKTKRDAPLKNPEVRRLLLDAQRANDSWRKAWTPERRQAQSVRVKQYIAENPEARFALAERMRGREMSDETRAKLSVSARAATLRAIEEGRHVGWQSRKIISYPERFWMAILNEAEVKYTHNAPVKREEIGLPGFGPIFLDFLIIGANGELLDLEIDGKQHLYPERVKSDAKRDAALLKAGYLIHRAPWVNPRTRGEELNSIIQSVESFLSSHLARAVTLSS